MPTFLSFYLFLLSASPLFCAKLDHLHILDSLLKKDYDRRATPTNHLIGDGTVRLRVDSPVRVEGSNWSLTINYNTVSGSSLWWNKLLVTLKEFIEVVYALFNEIGSEFDNATTVACELYIRSFGSISPVNMDYEVDLNLRQKWHDERLQHAKITEVLDLSDPNLVKAIWKPEVYFPNAKHAEFQFVTVPNVLIRINPDGQILYMLRLKLTFSCMMDLSKFPLDNQICTMEVASFSKTIEELKLEWKKQNPVIMGKGLRMPQFEIVKIAASDCQESFQIGNYSCLVAEFYLSRSIGFHFVQNYLPTILIVVISWVSFWMDVDSVPGRTTLGVTTLLAISSQSAGIQSGLPQVSYVKAIDVWMGTCTAFVFCALLEFTFVNFRWRKVCRDNISLSTGFNGDLPLPDDPAFKKACEGAWERTSSARRIDEYSRFGFPLVFLFFNFLYWSYYLSS